MFKIFKKNSYLFIILLLLYSNGCSSSKNYSSLFGEFIADSLTINISPDEFKKLKTSNCCHGGFGSLINMRGWGITMFDVVFKKILYNPNDSLLYIEGNLTESKKTYILWQIIMGRILKDNNSQMEKGRIDIHINYLVHEDGSFCATLPVWKDTQMIITSREIYNNKGEYFFTPVSYVFVYDVSKLRDMYKPKIKSSLK